MFRKLAIVKTLYCLGNHRSARGFCTPGGVLTDRLIQRLQGRWQVVRIVDPGGADYVPRKKVGWIVEGHTMTSFGNDLSFELPFRLDESLSPAHLDILTASQGNSDHLGLIEVAGDRLKLANSGNTGDKTMPIRPAKLEPSLGVYYCEMERAREDARETAKVPGTEKPLDRQNARAVVEAFVAAALAGDSETARALAENLSSDHIADLANGLNVKRLAMKSVYVNDPMKPTGALRLLMDTQRKVRCRSRFTQS